MSKTPITKRRKRRVLSNADIQLWTEVTRQVKPLRSMTALPLLEPAPESEQVEKQPAQPPFPTVRLAPSPRSAPPKTITSVLTHGTTAGVDRRTAERFKKGTMEIDGRIDLHGMTRDAARVALHSFITQSVARRRRVILVITGKGRQNGGQGVLKAEVPHWLNEPSVRSYILSFSYAQPKHGGEGALYVYLKRDRNR